MSFTGFVQYFKNMQCKRLTMKNAATDVNVIILSRVLLCYACHAFFTKAKKTKAFLNHCWLLIMTDDSWHDSMLPRLIMKIKNIIAINVTMKHEFNYMHIYWYLVIFKIYFLFSHYCKFITAVHLLSIFYELNTKIWNAILIKSDLFVFHRREEST